MKRKASSWFAAPIYLIVLFLTAGFSAALDAQAPVEDDSLAELSRRIEELDQQGKYQEAIPLAEKLLALTKEARGLDDRETAARIGLLAALYESMGDYSKAEPLYKEALEIRRKVLGPNHPKTADSLTYLAELYFAMREYAKAEPLLQQALQVRQKILGKKHPETLTSLNNLAALYESMGE